ncbi:HAD family hydrolase [Naumannella halotolerans]|uniref:HAD superfamily hydrolase (TIGR01509 family) n=1 Tax=Naumannella halotolerans TaxID=993414 RepID=A0A4R7IZ01_9ACTN|nr:HAD-IA family hydrolase [Naumannella halotolerans]TDT30021.1 HAD superfamily hydrolase (TIGR01509 family) [Naumannella halotolerans]
MTLLNWDSVGAALFDLDGVITPTAEVHMRAWEKMFNDYLSTIDGQAPYTTDDYFAHVDGKPRLEGVRTFLTSRGIELPEGDPDDPPEADTLWGLGNRKNALFTQVLDEEGIQPYPGSIQLVDALLGRGVRCAIVSSSKNAKAVLATADVIGKFELIVDGVVAAEQGLAGKPAPDTYAWAAEQFGLPNDRAVVLEDAISGVQSGRAGRFAHVVGVDRGAGEQALRDNGADIVVTDLAELLPDS